ncbi:uncharacterized protein C5orf34 homolog [Pocillopora damicornis]|uniref:uncharacterized protein C5orf34 homolog n=1 Tax=Pocillopora damicornis TaxID=46731 RepID=UPI000F55182C|nr:uncharacterized protein C5orf34 homolog [Pocillopora damicornis]
MAADLKRCGEMCSIDLIVLYENDRLFIKYSDDSSIELSSCGSAFVHRQTALSSSAQFRQLTRFAVSSFRSKIKEAIRIRNLFAARPYLCKELTDPQDLKIGYKDVTQCCWPDEPSSCFITTMSDGSACVMSVDGLASLTLMPHRQTFIVKFLAEVRYDSTKMMGNKVSEMQCQKHYFALHKKIHSVFSYPEAWKYPLQLVLDAVNNKAKDPSCSLHKETTLPVSLPVTCSASHLHTWNTQMPHDDSCLNWEFLWKPKVIWKDGVTYRVFCQSPGLFTMEIHPVDGSVMRSQRPNGRYFDHWFVHNNEQTGLQEVEIQERVYSADKPLPHRLLQRTEYSIGRLLKQATRYMEFLKNAGYQGEECCCWKETSKSTTVLSKPSCPVHLVDAADVPGTGRFKAYSNGHISVVFNDRTILDVRNSSDHKKNDLQNRWCQLVLSNGNVQQFKLNDVEQCGFYKRYTEMALHWAEWVAATPSQRRTFYKDTIWDPERRRAVDIEMGKIKTFNYVHNQNHVEHLVGKKFQDIQDATENDSTEPGSGQGDRETIIRRVLEQTSEAICEIDGLLTTLKCSS